MSRNQTSLGVIAVLGVGRVGAAVARTALRAGYTVQVASSGGVERIEMLVEVVIPGAHAMVAAEAVRDADIVVIAVPLSKFRSVDPEMLAGKVVVDVMNYWPPVDGHLPAFDVDATSSEVVAEHFGRSRLVKTLNHIGYHELEQDAAPAGSRDRRALAVAADDDEASRLVAAFIDRLGFDPIGISPLRAGEALQPGTPIFSGTFDAAALEAALSQTTLHQL